MFPLQGGQRLSYAAVGVVAGGQDAGGARGATGDGGGERGGELGGDGREGGVAVDLGVPALARRRVHGFGFKTRPPLIPTDGIPGIVRYGARYTIEVVLKPRMH